MNELQSGLEKLAEAEKTVDTLSQTATDQRKQLGKKQIDAENSLQRITSSMARAADRRREVEDLQNKLSAEEVSNLSQELMAPLQTETFTAAADPSLCRLSWMNNVNVCNMS